MTLRGVPLEQGGIQMTGSSVSFGPRARRRPTRAQIVSLEGSRLVASVHDSSGGALGLQIVLSLDSSTPHAERLAPRHVSAVGASWPVEEGGLPRLFAGLPRDGSPLGLDQHHAVHGGLPSRRGT